MRETEFRNSSLDRICDFADAPDTLDFELRVDDSQVGVSSL